MSGAPRTRVSWRTSAPTARSSSGCPRSPSATRFRAPPGAYPREQQGGEGADQEALRGARARRGAPRIRLRLDRWDAESIDRAREAAVAAIGVREAGPLLDAEGVSMGLPAGVPPRAMGAVARDVAAAALRLREAFFAATIAGRSVLARSTGPVGGDVVLCTFGAGGATERDHRSHHEPD